MDLIENLLKYKNKKNSNLIIELSHIIKTNKITDLKQLEEYEKNIFKISCQPLTKEEPVHYQILTKEQQINYCLSILNSFPFDYDLLDYEEIQKYKLYKKNIIESPNTEEKIKNLIKIFDLTNRELFFPFEAYNLIIENKL